MLDTRNLTTGCLTEKLTPCQEGLFRVLKVLLHTIQLALLVNIKINNTFYVQLIQLQHKLTVRGQEKAEKNVRANCSYAIVRTNSFKEEECYKFEEVQGYRKANNSCQQYLVKWKSYKEPTQQPISDLKGYNKALWQYYNAYPEQKPPAWLKRRKKDTRKGPAIATLGIGNTISFRRASQIKLS